MPSMEIKYVLEAFCQVAGVPIEDTYIEQAAMFGDALKKNHEREQTYNGLWKEYGIDDCVSNVRMKVLRMQAHIRNMEAAELSRPEVRTGEAAGRIYDDALDDALDMINYGAFVARLVEESRLS